MIRYSEIIDTFALSQVAASLFEDGYLHRAIGKLAALNLCKCEISGYYDTE